MKNLRLTLIAATCSLAIAACSSSHDNHSSAASRINNAQGSTEQVGTEEATAQKATEEAAAQKATEEAAAQKAAEEAAAQKAAEEAAAQKAAEEAAAQKAAEEAAAQKAAEEAAAQKAAEEAAAQKAAEEAAAQKAAEEAAAQKAAEEAAAQKAAEEAAAQKAAEEAAAQKAAEEAAAQKAAEEQAANDKANMSDMISNNIGEIQKTFVNNNGTNGGRSNLSGAIISIKDGKFTQQNIDLETSNNINELVIDGKPITLFSNEDITNRRSEDQNSYNIYDIRSDNVTGKVGSLPKRAFDDNFAQLRYGYVKDNDGKITLFVQGHQTPVQGQIDTPFSYYWAGKNNNTEVLRALPKEGIWEYLGTAFYGKDQNYKELDTSAIVDITNKKVKVDVKENGTNKLTFGGNIEGNTFSGNYHGVESKGAFYGTNGIDIGGTFYQTQGNEKGYNGVFGATQQNCSWSGCAQLENKDALKDFNVSK